MNDLLSRLANRVQLTTDGHSAPRGGRGRVRRRQDYSLLIKLYGDAGGGSPERKYAPGKCTGIRVRTIEGQPDPDKISTSYVERNNLTMRMSMRRVTRLTNAFSKRIENHAHSVALHFTHYNFCQIHSLPRLTPTMAVGVTGRLMDVDDIVRIVEDAAPKLGPRSPTGRKFQSDSLPEFLKR